MTISLEDAVAKIEELPPMPAVVMDVFESIDQETVNFSHLTRKIIMDQALAAKILRCANSSYYNTQSSVTTIQQAITLIGVSGVRNLVVAAVLKGSFPECYCHGFDYDVFWRHSIGVAVCAKVLARHLQLNQDQAYTAGLLHDVGRLALVTHFTSQYEQAVAWRAEHDCHILQAEREVLGIDHVQTGEALARHWKFSRGIQNAIAKHHEPDMVGGDTIAAIVHIADAVSHALDFAGDPDDLVPPVSLSVWNALSLDERSWHRVFRETELRFESAKLGLMT
ncbi:MAG: HDOD domain-containing protein [Burkholderiaceae bacterium]|nr:HDOD domain-containing protein [Burkholderiaceae bacterium]